eukprot:878345-Amphidinium_carterae.1
MPLVDLRGTRQADAYANLGTAELGVVEPTVQWTGRTQIFQVVCLSWALDVPKLRERPEPVSYTHLTLPTILLV